MNREYSKEELSQLVARAKAGDKEAFAVIYEAFYTPIFRYLYGRTSNRDLAEDLTQDVFLKAYRGLVSYQERGHSTLAYFYTIARNCLIDHWRKQEPLLLDEDYLVEYLDDEARADKLAEESEAKRLITFALGALTVGQREILTLKYLNDLSNKEIADLLGKSEGSIRQNLSRALRSLNEKMEKYGL